MLQAGKLTRVAVHGTGAVTRQLQQRILVRDKQRRGGDGEGKEPAGRIRTRDGEPGTVSVPFPRRATGERVDGQRLLTGLPRIEEEELPLCRLLVPPLLGESRRLGLRRSEAEGGGRLGVDRVRSHVMAMDPRVVARKAGRQGLQQGGVVRSAGPHMESGDLGVPAHYLCHEV